MGTQQVTDNSALITGIENALKELETKIKGHETEANKHLTEMEKHEQTAKQLRRSLQALKGQPIEGEVDEERTSGKKRKWSPIIEEVILTRFNGKPVADTDLKIALLEKEPEADQATAHMAIRTALGNGFLTSTNEGLVLTRMINTNSADSLLRK